jgi:hypothetical protein
MRWLAIFIIALSTAALSQTMTGQLSAYDWPIIRITNTTDFAWCMTDTVRAVYREMSHTTVLGLDGRATKWLNPPYVIEVLKPKR